MIGTSAAIWNSRFTVTGTSEAGDVAIIKVTSNAAAKT